MSASSMTQTPKWMTPTKSIIRATGKALHRFNMIQDGDKILLGLSGGKDSLALLHVLHHFQKAAPITFSIGVVTVDPMSDDFSPQSLIPYIEGLGLPYHFEQEPIIERAKEHMEGDSFCSFCSRMRRGIMYGTARKHGYNVLALAQHLDDLAESFLMSAFHGGKLKTMKANYTIGDGDLRVIRPLAFVRERQTRAFALKAELPVIMDNCPACFAMPTAREHMKQLLAREEDLNPKLMGSLKSAMMPLMGRDTIED